ncbi:MAG: four helix bundle protein [Saprospiraceae bacterium]|nr:four helix bundle protein [Saprospiraceae bacterium]
MTEDELKKRLKDWAVAVVLFTRQFPKEPEFKAVRGQLVRSAPSAAANYRAACRGKSTPDFINKLKTVEEELDESMFWLEFAVALSAELRPPVVPLYKEADELLAIIVASIKTSRAKPASPKPSKPPKPPKNNDP